MMPLHSLTVAAIAQGKVRKRRACGKGHIPLEGVLLINTTKDKTN